MDGIAFRGPIYDEDGVKMQEKTTYRSVPLLDEDSQTVYHRCPVGGCMFMLPFRLNENKEIQLAKIAVQFKRHVHSPHHFDSQVIGSEAVVEQPGRVEKVPNTAMVFDYNSKVAVCLHTGYILGSSEVWVHTLACKHCKKLRRDLSALNSLKELKPKGEFSECKRNCVDARRIEFYKRRPISGLLVTAMRYCKGCLERKILKLGSLNSLRTCRHHGNGWPVLCNEYVLLGDTRDPARRRYCPINERLLPAATLTENACKAESAPPVLGVQNQKVKAEKIKKSPKPPSTVAVVKSGLSLQRDDVLTAPMKKTYELEQAENKGEPIPVGIPDSDLIDDLPSWFEVPAAVDVARTAKLLQAPEPQSSNLPSISKLPPRNLQEPIDSRGNQSNVVEKLHGLEQDKTSEVIRDPSNVSQGVELPVKKSILLEGDTLVEGVNVESVSKFDTHGSRSLYGVEGQQRQIPAISDNDDAEVTLVPRGTEEMPNNCVNYKEDDVLNGKDLHPRRGRWHRSVPPKDGSDQNPAQEDREPVLADNPQNSHNNDEDSSNSPREIAGSTTPIEATKKRNEKRRKKKKKVTRRLVNQSFLYNAYKNSKFFYVPAVKLEMEDTTTIKLEKNAPAIKLEKNGDPVINHEKEDVLIKQEKRDSETATPKKRRYSQYINEEIVSPNY